MALILRRRDGEAVVLKTSDGDVKISVEVDGRAVKLAISAPPEVKILREELLKRGECE